MLLHTLGELRLEGARFSRPKPLALMAYLALEGPLPRRRLARVLWPSGASAKSLSMALSMVRRAAPGVLRLEGSTVAVALKTDVASLLRALDGAQVERACALYPGPFLDGVRVRGTGVEFEEWLFTTRERLALELQRCLLRAAEAAWRLHRRRDAVRLAERARGVRGAAPLEGRDLGRLRVLVEGGGSAPAASLGAGGSEPGSTPVTVSPRRQMGRWGVDAVPEPPTCFVGRAQALAEARSAVAREDCRLLTLVGPAGVGKTALAGVLARAELERSYWSGRVALVRLAAITDPATVLTHVCERLGLAQRALRPPREVLVAALRTGPSLLVLDNLEQIPGVGEIVADLLASCPMLTVVATSRRPLRVRLECEQPVAPLPVGRRAPTSDGALARAPAVRLFLDCARRVVPAFAPDAAALASIHGLCRRLGGLPLAIELAAPRVRFLSPAQISRGVRDSLDLLTDGPVDGPLRQRTLRGAIGWSYRLLSPAERRLFRRLALFEGGFTAELAVAVAPGEGALERIGTLVAHQLVSVERAPAPGGRLRMLEPIRTFAWERLRDEAEVEEAARAHGAALASSAERMAACLRGPDAPAALRGLEHEHDDLRAVLRRMLRAGERAGALRLCDQLWRFWVVHGHMREGRRWLERALSMPGAPAPGALEGRARLALGTLIHEIGEYRTARAHLARSLRTWRARGDEERTATTLDALAWVETQVGAYDAAIRLSTEAAALHARRDDAAGRATSCTNLGWVAQYRGRPHRARTWHERSLALRRSLGDRRGAAYARINLSWSLLALGEIDAADAEVSAALALLAPLGDRQLRAWARTMQGRIARDRGAVGLARTRFARSVPLWRDVGNLHGVVISLSELASLLADVGAHDEALRRLREAEAANATVGNPWLEARQRLTRGRLRWQRGEHSAALRDAECAYRMRLALRDRRGAAVARGLWERWREARPPRRRER